VGFFNTMKYFFSPSLNKPLVEVAIVGTTVTMTDSAELTAMYAGVGVLSEDMKRTRSRTKAKVKRGNRNMVDGRPKVGNNDI